MKIPNNICIELCHRNIHKQKYDCDGRMNFQCSSSFNSMQTAKQREKFYLKNSKRAELRIGEIKREEVSNRQVMNGYEN